MLSKFFIASAALLGSATAVPQWFPGHPGHPEHPGHPFPTHHTTYHHTTYHHTTTHHPTTTHHTTTHHTTTTPHAAAGTTVHAHFDDLVAGNPARASRIRQYEDLFWQGFAVAKDQGGSAQVKVVVSGIIPETPPNVAYYDPAVIAVGGKPAIYSTYYDSNVTSFDLKSFWFACGTAAQAIVNSKPVDCSLTVSGYDTYGAQVNSETIAFFPDSPNTTHMKHVILSGFTNLTTVLFSTQQTRNRPIATLFDNFVYIVYPEKASETSTTTHHKTTSSIDSSSSEFPSASESSSAPAPSD